MKQFKRVIGAGIFIALSLSAIAQKQPAAKELQSPAYNINKQQKGLPPANSKLDLEVKKQELGRFDYTFLRLGYAFTGNAFYHPMEQLEQREYFHHTAVLKPSFAVGLDFGFTAHFRTLGTPKLRLGLNTNFNFQYFGSKTIADAAAKYKVATEDGSGIFCMGVGPQITFKPSRLIRIGVYGRIGLSVVAGNYNNTQLSREEDVEYQATVKVFNLAFFSKDIGVDVTFRKLIVGLSASFVKVSPRDGSLLSEDERNKNQFIRTNLVTSGTLSEDINPLLKFNRVALHLGLAL